MTVQQASPTGRILNIQHFCVDDGPGIRTTVFFKGCPLRCVWCHNPESHRSESEILYRADRCRACGACVAHCPQGAHTLAQRHQYDRERCLRCGKCATVCPVGALEQIGESRTVEEIMNELLSDRPFYAASHGGVTLSGGEPLCQADFAYEIFRLSHEAGINTCLDTSGSILNDSVKRLLSETDRSDRGYRENVGCGYAPVLDFLAYLNEKNISVTLRQVIIPSLNDNEENILELKSIAEKYSCVDKIELLPFRKMCTVKYETMGIEFPLAHIQEPSGEKMDMLKKILFGG